MRSNRLLEFIILIALFFSLPRHGSAQCYFTQPIASLGQNYSVSGSNYLDSVLTSEHSLLQTLYQLNVPLYYYNGNNGLYTPNCETYGCHGKIFLGKPFMLSLIDTSKGLEGIKAVLAHEWAHAYQNYWGWNTSSRYRELHADFLAGYYIGIKSLVLPQNVKAWAATFFEAGDDDFYNPNPHGTPVERSCAFYEGFITASLKHYNLFQAYYAGIDYVILNQPCISFSPNKTYIAAPISAPQADTSKRGTIRILFENDVLVYNTKYELLGQFGPDNPFEATLPHGNYNIIAVIYNKKKGKAKRSPMLKPREYGAWQWGFAKNWIRVPFTVDDNSYRYTYSYWFNRNRKKTNVSYDGTKK